MFMAGTWLYCIKTVLLPRAPADVVKFYKWERESLKPTFFQQTKEGFRCLCLRQNDEMIEMGKGGNSAVSAYKMASLVVYSVLFRQNGGKKLGYHCLNGIVGRITSANGWNV